MSSLPFLSQCLKFGYQDVLLFQLNVPLLGHRGTSSQFYFCRLTGDAEAPIHAVSDASHGCELPCAVALSAGKEGLCNDALCYRLMSSQLGTERKQGGAGW